MLPEAFFLRLIKLVFVVLVCQPFHTHAAAPPCRAIDAPGWKPVDCFDARIDYSRGPYLVVEVFERAAAAAPRSLHQATFYSHYEDGTVEPILSPQRRMRMFSVEVGGVRGSGVSQRLWVLYGYPGGRCRPFWVDIQHYALTMPGEGENELKLKRRIRSSASGLSIDLSYTWRKRVDDVLQAEKRWRERLLWDEARQAFSLQRVSGDGGEVQRRMDAYRRQIATLSCDDFHSLVEHPAMDLEGIFP